MGHAALPKKLVKQGVRDMLRISDARMSGTSYGACVLHVSPKSYVGGPLGLVRTGDLISIDVDARTLNLDVSDEELARRRAEWTPRRHATSAAMAGCSPAISSRRAKAATLISLKPPSAHP